VPALVVMGRRFFSLLKAAFLFVRKKGREVGGEKPAPALGHFASRSLQQLGKLMSHEAHLFVRHSLVQDIPR